MLKSLQAKFLLIFMFALLLNIFRMNIVYSGESKIRNPASTETKERLTENMNDNKRSLKKAKRNIENKSCRYINGKMECAAKRASNAIKSGADKVEDAVD